MAPGGLSVLVIDLDTHESLAVKCLIFGLGYSVAVNNAVFAVARVRKECDLINRGALYLDFSALTAYKELGALGREIVARLYCLYDVA